MMRPLSTFRQMLPATVIACLTAWLVGCSGDSAAPNKVPQGHADATTDTGSAPPEAGQDAGDANDASSADSTLVEAGDDGTANADASDDGGSDGSDGSEGSASAGTLGGACYGNNTCNDGLGCDAGVCVPMAMVGASGGVCYGNSTCDTGLVCTAGLCVQGPPALTYCESQAEAGAPARALPYNIAADFTYLETLGPGVADFTILANPDCSDGGVAFPPIPLSALFADASGNDSGSEGSASEDDGSADATASGDDGSADATASGDDGSADSAATVDGSADVSTAPSACYEFLYNPSCTTTGGCWSGVIFQSTPVNMGPGVCIAPGATMVTFQARSSRANARIKFGSTRAGVGTTEFYINITTSWQGYAVTLPAGEPYNAEPNTPGGVWNGFSVVVEPGDHLGGSYVLVRDIVWTM